METPESRDREDTRSDARGLLHLAGHLGALTVTGLCIVRWWGSVWVVPLVFAHGFVLVFLFSAAHECVHRTAFRTRRLNDVVAWAVGVLLLLPSRWFRLFHAAHHRFTQESGKDPELDGWKPPSRVGIVVQQSGLLYWKAMGSVVAGLICGRAGGPVVTEGSPRRGRARSSADWGTLRGGRDRFRARTVVARCTALGPTRVGRPTVSALVPSRRAHRMPGRPGNRGGHENHAHEPRHAVLLLEHALSRGTPRPPSDPVPPATGRAPAMDGRPGTGRLGRGRPGLRADRGPVAATAVEGCVSALSRAAGDLRASGLGGKTATGGLLRHPTGNFTARSAPARVGSLLFRRTRVVARRPPSRPSDRGSAGWPGGPTHPVG